jgi:hypothetical protein
VNFKKQIIDFINNVDLSVENIFKETLPDEDAQLKIKNSYEFYSHINKAIYRYGTFIRGAFTEKYDELFNSVNDRFTMKKICGELEMKMYISFAKTIVVNYANGNKNTKEVILAIMPIEID